MRLNVKIPYFITTIINSFYFCQKVFAIFLPRSCCHYCQEVVAGTVIAMAITGYNRRWQQLANPAAYSNLHEVFGFITDFKSQPADELRARATYLVASYPADLEPSFVDEFV